MSPAHAIRSERPSADEISRRVAELRCGATDLRALGVERRCAGLARAASMLCDASTPIGRWARERLPAITGLSERMVDWALRTSLAPITGQALSAILDGARLRAPDVFAKVPRLVSVVLAGNVFTAAIRPIFFSLLVGSPAACKASSRDDLFPALLSAALTEADPELGRSLAVVSFPGGTEALESALYSRSDVVVAYGGDETMEALRARLPATVRLIEHGHGASVAYFGGRAVASPSRAAEAAQMLALDIAAYDQRGCLSPQVLWVRRGGAVGRERVAGILHDALSTVETDLPRGPVPSDVGAAQMQWRGVMGVQGRLHVGRTHAVACPADGRLRLSPGHRNLAVMECDDVADLGAQLLPLGHHLKAIGTDCDQSEQERLLACLDFPLTPRLCHLGRMQTPPLDSFTEGMPPLDGLLRWVQTELPGHQAPLGSAAVESKEAGHGDRLRSIPVP